MDGSLVLVTAPASEPVTTQEAKDWARVTTTADDTLIGALITAAREHTERMTGRALLTQTWDYFLDCWPGGPYPYVGYEVCVPRPVLQSVTSVKYIDPNGVLQTLATSEYTVDTNRVPARIVPAYGKTWPSYRPGVPGAIQIRFVAGYGADTSTVLAGTFKNEYVVFQQAIKVLVATMYGQREMATPDSIALTEVPWAFWQLVNQYRVWSL